MGPSPVIRGPKIPLIRPCLALCLWERPVLAYGALPGSRYGPRNPRVTRFSNARRPRPGDTPRKFLCRLKSPTLPTNDQNEPLKSRVCERLSWLGTWDVQTEESCLSTRGPRKLAFISASLAIAAATWMPPDAQRARADIGKKSGLAHVRNPGVAESLRLRHDSHCPPREGKPCGLHA